MQETEKSVRLDCSLSTKDVPIEAIANRLIGHEEDLVRRIVAACLEEIVDYRAAGELLAADVAALTRDNLEVFLANLVRGQPRSSGQLEKTRQAAGRRVHQDVPLESFLHATRIWGRFTWEAVRAAVRDSPQEAWAALEIASRLIGDVDAISVVAAHAHLREAQGLSENEHVVPPDVLDALLGTEPDPDRARRWARGIGIRLAETYLVLSIRGPRPPVRWTVEAARGHLRPSSGSLLLGARDAEVVALYPVSKPTELPAAKEQAGVLARSVAASGATVGMSGWHPGPGGRTLAYTEAREAAHLAAVTGLTGRVVSLDEVLIDHIARSTPHVGRILDEILHPLEEYDRRHRTALVDTVRTYVETGFNLRRSAEVLHVHPNTVMYRLRRVRELCGRDPHDPEDLLILFLAMKLSELSPDRSGASTTTRSRDVRPHPTPAG
jgi:PucR-like helix-turn-helix protein/diguanylate cyclase with GGDEF domain